MTTLEDLVTGSASIAVGMSIGLSAAGPCGATGIGLTVSAYCFYVGFGSGFVWSAVEINSIWGLLNEGLIYPGINSITGD